MHIVLSSTYETMSISTGLYPNLHLWNANKLQLQLFQNISVTYITPRQKHENNNYMSSEFETFGSQRSEYDHKHHLGCDTL
jgi:hypothetical protein